MSPGQRMQAFDGVTTALELESGINNGELDRQAHPGKPVRREVQR
jgi:hypothetical protein